MHGRAVSRVVALRGPLKKRPPPATTASPLRGGDGERPARVAANRALNPPSPTAKAGRMNASPFPSVPPAGSAGPDVLRTLLEWPLPAVMGVLNVTPDSFSDGGEFIAPELAL